LSQNSRHREMTGFTCKFCNERACGETRANRPRQYCSRACYKESKKGSGNPNWKGSDVGVNGLHLWLKRNLQKPSNCQRCSFSRALDLANISPEYNPKTYTRDAKNWLWLCRKCHMSTDSRAARLQASWSFQEQRTCIKCNKQYVTKTRQHIYCSSACRAKQNNKNYKERHGVIIGIER
jgi:hypothetical protein